MPQKSQDAENVQQPGNQNGKPPQRRCVDPAAFAPDDPRLLEAYRRERIVLYAEGLPEGWPGRTKEVESAIEDGALMGNGPAPSRSTLYRWWKRYEDGERSHAALIDVPSTGRPPEPMHPWTERFLLRLARGRANLGPTALYTKGVEFAGRSRRNPEPPRNVSQVRRWLGSHSVRERIMAAHGTRAARAAAEVKRTYPTDRPNDLWQVDETHLPIWIRIWDNRRTIMKWVVGVAWAVFVRDHYSRAILGWWVKIPSPKKPLHTQFKAEEVLGTIAGAAVPELAHPVVQNLVTGDPAKIMMDGSGSMGKARRILEKRNLVDVGQSEPYCPWQNGGIENFFRTLKRRDIPDLVGSKIEWIVFDEQVDPRSLRQTNFDLGSAIPKLKEIPIESLPRPEHVRYAIGHFVREGNNTPSRAMNGDYPASRFLRDLEFVPDRPSRLVETFPVHQVKHRTRGVEIRNKWYQNEELVARFPLQTKLFVRRDPLERGVFVFPHQEATRTRSAGVFVPGHKEWARTLSPEDVAVQLRDERARMREGIDRDRGQVTADLLGQEAADELADAQDRRDKEQEKRSRKARRIRDAQRKKHQRNMFEGVEEPSPQQDTEDSADEPERGPGETPPVKPEQLQPPPPIRRRRPRRGVRLVDANLTDSK